METYTRPMWLTTVVIIIIPMFSFVAIEPPKCTCALHWRFTSKLCWICVVLYYQLITTNPYILQVPSSYSTAKDHCTVIMKVGVLIKTRYPERCILFNDIQQSLICHSCLALFLDKLTVNDFRHGNYYIDNKCMAIAMYTLL